MEQNYLMHFGIKGQKWGVRRYQNEDGTLTDKGKKRISKQYKKYSVKALEDYANDRSSLYVKAYNKTVDKFNSGLTDKFNAEQEKKYGSKYAERDEYYDDYQTHFGKHVANEFNKTVYDYMSQNTNYKKGKELVDKYNMQSWDDLAKQNEEAMNQHS